MAARMDTWSPLLQEGIARLKLAPVADEVLGALGEFADELLKWNARVNLTAITEPVQVVDKHLLDAMAVLPELDSTGHRRVLDLGAGAGLPGLVWALARPRLEVCLVDSVGKKVAFMKAAAVRLGLSGRVRAVHAHIRGTPGDEGLAPAEVVVSRAFRDLETWLRVAPPYVSPAGVIIAMTGRALDEVDLDCVGQNTGATRVSARHFRLPFSGDHRGVSVWRPKRS